MFDHKEFGMNQLFDSLNLNYQIGDIKKIYTNQILFYGGGGNLVGLYKNAENFLQQNLEANKVVILPHTIKDCPKLLEVIDRNPQTTIICREKKSRIQGQIESVMKEAIVKMTYNKGYILYRLIKVAIKLLYQQVINTVGIDSAALVKINHMLIYNIQLGKSPSIESPCNLWIYGYIRILNTYFISGEILCQVKGKLLHQGNASKTGTVGSSKSMVSGVERGYIPCQWRSID